MDKQIKITRVDKQKDLECKTNRIVLEYLDSKYTITPDFHGIRINKIDLSDQCNDTMVINPGCGNEITIT